jgi:type III pantothenate kinase
MSQYIVADKGGVQSAVSGHVAYLTDEQVFRMVLRVDGQPTGVYLLRLYSEGRAATQKAVLVSASLDLGIAIRYENPQSVGADRICNAIAGFKKYGGPLIIIDFGTATTFDVVASNGDYLGGVIAPGIETSAVDLHRRAAKLPKVELHLPRSVIGADTVSSMQSGILWGAVDAAIGMVERIQLELIQRESKKGIVIATGGFSEFVSQHARVIQHTESSLVLDGIRLIYERVSKKK